LAIVLLDELLLGRSVAASGPRRRPRRAPLLLTVAVLSIAAPLAMLAEDPLIARLGLEEVRLPLLVLAIAAVTAGAAALRRRTDPAAVLLDATLLGVALLASHRPRGAADAMTWAVATGAAFILFSSLFANLHTRLQATNAPGPLRGAALMLVSAGIFTLGFSGLATLLPR
jgi:electron transport complex protein RnfA